MLFTIAIVSGGACGEDEVSDVSVEPSEASSSQASVEDAQEWCALYVEALPALSPTPVGREVEALGRYVERYERLAVDAPGVPASATAAARRLAQAYGELRERVRGGEQLDVILETESEDSGSVIFTAGVELDEAVRSLCE